MSTKAIERKVQVPALAPSDGRQIAPEVSQLHATVQKLAEAHNYHDDQLNQALRGGTSSENNAKMVYKDLRIAMPLDPPYLPLTLNAGDGWVDAGSVYVPGYLMEPGGHVSLRGLVNGGTPGYGATGRITTLPAGYQPGQPIGFAGEGGTGVVGIIRVSSSGNVYFAASTDPTPYIYLEMCQWIAPSAARPHAFTGGAWPMVISHGFDKCRALDVVACRPAESQDGISGTIGAPVPDWEDLGNGTLRLNAVWGLQWGSVYTMRVRLSSEA